MKRKFKFIGIIAFTIMLLLVVVSCGKESTPLPTPTPTPSEKVTTTVPTETERTPTVIPGSPTPTPSQTPVEPTPSETVVPTPSETEPEDVYYTVSFVDDHAEFYADINVLEGTVVQEPEIPPTEIDKYLFIGWFIGEERYDFDAVVVKDLTLVAKYEEIILTLSGDEAGEAGAQITLELTVTPEFAIELEIEWSSSDESIATVKDGLVTLHNVGVVTITVQIAGASDTIEITVEEPVITTDSIAISGTNKWMVGETVSLYGDVVPENATNKEFTWVSEDETIATVDAFGVVTLLAEGEVNINAVQGDVVSKYKVTIMEEFDFVYDYFLSHVRKTVYQQTIMYYGGGGEHDLYPSVHPYLFNDPITLKRVMVPYGKSNHSNLLMPSLEWIVIHDIGATGGAEGNANYQAYNNDAGVSWHYTVGTDGDGWYQSLEHEDVGWHAGDGSAKAGFTDTGIPARHLKPELTIDEAGYYVIEGQKTDVMAPEVSGRTAKNSDMVPGKLWPVIINGTYHMPFTRYATTNGGGIVFNGGNYNGIGIETSVAPGSDVWHTWHRTAKLVAKLLIDEDMLLDRVTYHNHFSAKSCPQTAMRSDNWDNWRDLIEYEYMVLKYFSNYIFTLNSENLDILSPTGRIKGDHPDRTFVRFTITIENAEGDTRTTPSQRTVLRK